MPVRTVQYRWTSGEFDPKLIGRSDVDFYYSAAETMTNVIVIPQGGFKRRDGLEYLDRAHRMLTRDTGGSYSAPNGGTAGNANDDDTGTSLTTTTNISTNDDYVVVSVDLGSAKSIAVIDTVGVALTSGSSMEFDVEVSTDGVSWTVVDNLTLGTASFTYRSRVRGSYRYARLIRNGTTDLGTAKATLTEFNIFTESTTASETKIAEFAFSNEQSYILLFSDKNIAVYKEGVFQTDIRALEHTSAKLSKLKWTQSADTGIFCQPTIPVYELIRFTDTYWEFTPLVFDYIPKYDFSTTTTSPATTLTPSAVEGTITLTAGSSVFSASDVDQYIDGNGGRARIVSYTSGTVVQAVTIIPFYSTSAIASGNWTIERGWEDVWSSTRGYPVSATFHDGRLWFGGSQSLPQTVWASRVGLFFDFNQGAILDSDAIEATLDTDQVNAIENIFSQRTLQIFTSGGEFAILQTLNEAITPNNINIRRQTQRGSFPNLRVVENEGQTLFVQRGGNAVLGFVYSELEQNYTNNEISKFASHLVKLPVDACIRKATSTEESAIYLLANNDGTLTTATLLINQNVIAFTEQTTDGLFKNCGVDVETMYFTVEREIDGQTDRYLERFNADHTTDSSKRITSGLPTDTFSGLDHLEGETVKVKADDSILADVTISSGSATIERDADTYVEFGLDYTPMVKTMPIEIPQIGPLLGRKKRISEVVLRLFETVGISVSSNDVSFRGFGPASLGSPLDEAPPEFTGDKVIGGITGWSDRGQITITQEEPVKMTVLNMSMRVKV